MDTPTSNAVPEAGPATAAPADPVIRPKPEFVTLEDLVVKQAAYQLNYRLTTTFADVESYVSRVRFESSEKNDAWLKVIQNLKEEIFEAELAYEINTTTERMFDRSLGMERAVAHEAPPPPYPVGKSVKPSPPARPVRTSLLHDE